MADESRIDFERVVGSPDQVDELYALLEARTHSISHAELPTLDEHTEFVRTHPYRAWYLVRKDQAVVGSFYLQEDNSIGLNLGIEDAQLADAVLAFLAAHFKPNSAVRSLVPPYFYINVAYSNDWLKQTLQNKGLTPIQTAFRLNERAE